jgi:lysylphosphatidylglycerol synthetase-like protein (DUF2156 family)
LLVVLSTIHIKISKEAFYFFCMYIQPFLQRESIIECIHRWGGSVVESILDPSCNIFSSPEIEGLIGYCENKGCIVVFGDPVCALSERAPLVEAFQTFCGTKKKNIIYLVASKEFTEWWMEKYDGGLISFGDELFVDPHRDPRWQTGKKGISLRGKIRHAERNGVTVHEYKGGNTTLEKKMELVAAQWLKNRDGPQIFISTVRLFSERFGKRWFYARQEKKLVGCLVLNHLNAKEGWVLDRIMWVPSAPKGTSEKMVVSVMETIAKEDCHFLTFGASNGLALQYISGFSKTTAFLAQHLYRASSHFFKLDGRRKFWEKFLPDCTPSFLVFKRPHLGIYEIQGLLEALNVSYFKKSAQAGGLQS